MFSARGDNTPVEAGNWNFISRFCDRVLRLCVKLGIRLLQKVVGRLRRLNISSVVDEFFDRDARRQLGHSAKVIAVPVRRDQMIDLLYAGIFHRGLNPRCVSGGRRPDVAGVDQYRLSGWRGEQRCITTLDIDDVDIQCFCCPRLCD